MVNRENISSNVLRTECYWIPENGAILNFLSSNESNEGFMFPATYLAQGKSLAAHIWQLQLIIINLLRLIQTKQAICGDL